LFLRNNSAKLVRLL